MRQQVVSELMRAGVLRGRAHIGYASRFSSCAALVRAVLAAALFPNIAFRKPVRRTQAQHASALEMSRCSQQSVWYRVTRRHTLLDDTMGRWRV